MGLSPEALERLASSHPFTAEGPSQLRSELAARALSARLEAAETVCRQGSHCSHLALVVSGQARVFKIGESGREITLYRVESGESCVLTTSCILSSRPFPAFAVCETPLEAVLVSNRDVIRWLELFPAWRDYVFGLIAARMADVISLIEEVAFRRMDRRVARHLLMRRDPLTGSLRTTHQRIASELGTSREVVSRILKDLEESGFLSVGRGSLLIRDPEGLARTAED